MSKIAIAEDTIMAHVKQLFGNHVRIVEWAPPDWDEDFIKGLLKTLPGVLLIFGGGERIDPGGQGNRFRTHWTVVGASRHVQTAKLAARGDAREIGCYQIIEAAIGGTGVMPGLNGFRIDGVGTLECTGWVNDMALKLQRDALMVQSAEFEMVVDLTAELQGGDLADFRRFYAEYDIGQPETAPKTEDKVNLPQ